MRQFKVVETVGRKTASAKFTFEDKGNEPVNEECPQSGMTERMVEGAETKGDRTLSLLWNEWQYASNEDVL
ncbi:MAG: hypothetical protein ABH886_01440 [Candidatus Desantisbacteria bacterium]